MRFIARARRRNLNRPPGKKTAIAPPPLLIIFTITTTLIRSVNDIPVILLVLFLVLSLLLALACGLRRFSHQQKEKAKKKRGGESERRADRMRPQVLIYHLLHREKHTLEKNVFFLVRHKKSNSCRT